MTYFGFLAIFLGIPLVFLAGLTGLDKRSSKKLPAGLDNWPAWAALLLHMGLAVMYTTPWDNYLVATGVWYYNPALVTGITLGWVPIEEYSFFVLQTLLTGLWLLYLARHLPVKDQTSTLWKLPKRSFLFIAISWLCAVLILATGWQPGTYLGLILIWALPPIALQLAFGADILWSHRRLITLTLVPVTVYLGITDSLAIGSGTWTIDPAHSLNAFLGGVLPLEEFVFFLVTNTLIAFGMTLLLAQESHQRIRLILETKFFRVWREKVPFLPRKAEKPSTLNSNDYSSKGVL